MIETYESGKPLPARFSKRGKTLQLACVKYLYPEKPEDRAPIASYGLVFFLNHKEGLHTNTRELLPVLKPLLAEMATFDQALPIEQQKIRLLLFIGEGPGAITRAGGCIEDCYASKLGATPRMYHAVGCPLYEGFNDVKVWTDPLPGLVRILNPSGQIMTARLLYREKLSGFSLYPGIREYALPMWAQLGLPADSISILERLEEDQPVYRIQFREERQTFL